MSFRILRQVIIRGGVFVGNPESNYIEERSPMPGDDWSQHNLIIEGNYLRSRPRWWQFRQWWKLIRLLGQNTSPVITVIREDVV